MVCSWKRLTFTNACPVGTDRLVSCLPRALVPSGCSCKLTLRPLSSHRVFYDILPGNLARLG